MLIAQGHQFRTAQRHRDAWFTSTSRTAWRADAACGACSPIALWDAPPAPPVSGARPVRQEAPVLRRLPEGHLLSAARLKCLRTAGAAAGYEHARRCVLYFQFSYIPDPLTRRSRRCVSCRAGWLHDDRGRQARPGPLLAMPVPATAAHGGRASRTDRRARCASCFDESVRIACSQTCRWARS